MILEMSFLSVFFGRKSSLLFWQKGTITFVWKRNPFFTKHREIIIFWCIILRKISFTFRLKNKTIFLGERNIIFPNITRKNLSVQFLLEDYLLRTFEKRKHGFLYSETTMATNSSKTAIGNRTTETYQ